MRPGLHAILLWAPAVATMAVVSITLSISVPLFALLLERSGASGAQIGVNHTVAALAMVICAPLLPVVLARVGLVALMLGSLTLLAIGMAAIPIWQSQLWWGALRVCWGVAGTALFFASEYWLVSATPEATRGRIIGIYVLILSASYMVGPVLLNLLGIDSWLTYAVPTAIVVAAAVPVIIGRRLAPDASAEVRPSPLALLKFFRTDPMVVWGVVLFGVVEFGAMGLITVWGLRVGHGQEVAVGFVFWLAFGSMAFQLPVGWAADRFDRRTLLALAGAVSMAMPLGVIAFATSAAMVAAFVTVWGGTAVACYSLALTELGARYRGAVLADANAAVVLAYALGALAAPVAFGSAMDLVPPHGLMWLAALAAAAYLALSLVRIGRGRRESLDRTS